MQNHVQKKKTVIKFFEVVFFMVQLTDVIITVASWIS